MLLLLSHHMFSPVWNIKCLLFRLIWVPTAFSSQSETPLGWQPRGSSNENARWCADSRSRALSRVLCACFTGTVLPDCEDSCIFFCLITYWVFCAFLFLGLYIYFIYYKIQLPVRMYCFVLYWACSPGVLTMFFKINFKIFSLYSGL